MRAWDFKKKVCIIEKGTTEFRIVNCTGRLGGAGLHNGALSSKAMWELSKDYRKTLVTDRGFKAENVVLNFREVMKAVEDAQEDKESQMRRQLEILNIPIFKGHARFENSKEVSIESQTGTKKKVTADYFIIATGSRPRKHDSIIADSKHILTSDDVEHLEDFPKSLAVVGEENRFQADSIRSWCAWM